MDIVYCNIIYSIAPHALLKLHPLWFHTPAFGSAFCVICAYSDSAFFVQVYSCNWVACSWDCYE